MQYNIIVRKRKQNSSFKEDLIMRKIVTDDQIQAIIKANESVCGTVDYRKYYMCCEYKHKEIDNTQSAWKYVAWTIPQGTSKFVIFNFV